MVILALLGILGILVAIAISRMAYLKRMPIERRRVWTGAGPIDHVVVLVHGTFARRADWTQKESRLCQRLREELDQGLTIHALDWSGGNGVGARKAAGKELRLFIRELASEHPEASLHVVTHSHGGNVALYALNDDLYQEAAEQDGRTSPRRMSEDSKRKDIQEVTLRGALAPSVAGLACLAAPFLHARERNLGEWGERLVFCAVLPWLLIAFWLLDRAGTADWIALLIVSPIALVTFGFAMLYGRVKRLVTELSLGTKDLEDKLFIARMGGDEATAGLMAGQFAAAATTRLFVLLGQTVGRAKKKHGERAERWSRFSRAAVVSLVLGVLLWLASVLWQVSLLRNLGAILSFVGLGFWLCLITPALSIVYTYAFAILVLPATILLSLVLLPGFGARIALSNLFLDVSVESTPPGVWEIHQLEPEDHGEPTDRSETGASEDDREDRPPGMRHSVVYEDPGVLDALAKWGWSRH